MQSVVVDIDNHTPQGGGGGAAPSASGKEGANEEAKKAGEPSGPTAFWADLAEKSQKLLEPVKRASDQLQRQPSWLSTSVASIQGLNARASEAAKKVVSDTTEASVAGIQSINARASEAAKKVVGNTAEASIQEQEAAATKVQAVHRGNAARRGLKFLQDQADEVQKKTKKVFNQADFAKPLEDLKHGVEEGVELVRRATFDPLTAKARLASPAFKNTVSNIQQAASVTKLHDMQVRAARKARDESKLLLMVLRGRARQWLKRNEMASAAISVFYLVLIFTQIVMEELPTGEEFNSVKLQVFSWIDLVFLVFFFSEYLAHVLVDGIKFFRRADGTWEKLYIVDASTVVLSLVLSSLNAAKVIDTQLSIFRLFRLLRLLKVAIAVQRVKGRTEKFRKKGGHGEAGPPTCNWESAGKHRFDAQNNKMPAPTAKYSAFLSHYKMEAAADARYLEQHLEAMTNTNVFIDSNDLVDLEKIFEEGVLKSEMIVLLGTKGVLTRPWCLLELYEARRHEIPVVTFAMSAHGFTPAFARAHLLDDGGLKSKLPDGAEALICEYIAENPLPGGKPDTWERFVELVTEAIDPTGAGILHPPLYQEWHNMGADEQVKAEMRALVMSMARVTHRKLEWKETAHEEPEAEPLSWKDRLLCRGSKPPKHVMCVFQREGSSAARVLQGGLQPKLGRPLLLSGQWEPNYRELAEARNALDALEQQEGVEESAKEEAQKKLDAAREKVSEHIEDAVSIGVRDSAALIVLLTKRVLSCPFTLLEVYTALDNNITVVPVMVAGSGYDFAAVNAQLEELDQRLEDQMGGGPYTDMVELLALRGVSMSSMKTLLKKLPKLIAVTMELTGAGKEERRSSNSLGGGDSPPTTPTAPATTGGDSPTTQARKEAQAEVEGESNDGFLSVIVNRCLKKK